MSGPDAHASAVLRDVFAISGRGMVIVCETLEGTVRMGDQATGRNARIGCCGHRNAEPTAEKAGQRGLACSTRCGPDAVKAAIGQRVRFFEGAA